MRTPSNPTHEEGNTEGPEIARATSRTSTASFSHNFNDGILISRAGSTRSLADAVNGNYANITSLEEQVQNLAEELHNEKAEKHNLQLTCNALSHQINSQ